MPICPTCNRPLDDPTRGSPGGFQATAPLTIDALASRWNVSTREVRRRIANWRLPNFGGLRSRIFRQQDIEAAEARAAGVRK